MNQLVPVSAHTLPAVIAAAGDRACIRFLEFFAAQIRNPHTRRAYARAAHEFLAWCEGAGVTSIEAVQPLHVATWIEGQTRGFRPHGQAATGGDPAFVRLAGDGPGRAGQPGRIGAGPAAHRQTRRRCWSRARHASFWTAST
jgi:hypothetical protein